MGKMKKIAALLSAGILCMSMGMNVLAAPSVTDPKPEPNVVIGSGTDKDGNYYNIDIDSISKEVENVLTDMDAVQDIFEAAGYDVAGSNKKITIYYLGVGDLSVENGEVPEGGIDIPFKVGNDQAKPGDTIYVMHQKSDGTWEILEGVLDSNNSMSIHFDSLSPIAVVKLMSDGSTVVLDKDENKLGELNPGTGGFEKAKEIEKADKLSESSLKKIVSEKKSPKTGE